MSERTKLRILQYNVNKSRKNVMISLLQKKNIVNYDVLVIQKSWRNTRDAHVYNSCNIDFTLINNEDKLCFLINKKINSNNWMTTWHFEEVETITMRHRFNIVMMINIHEIYNSSFASHTKTTNLSSLLALKQTLRMQSENIIVDDFNLHHSLWAKFFYSRQHALFETLMKLMREADATLTLLENTITRNDHEERTTIDLFFITNALINKLIRCDINHSMKNFFDHLFVETCVKLRLVEKFARRFRRDWKSMNLEKFEQYLKAYLSTSLSKAKRERQRIDEYTELLLKSIEKTMKNFTS